MTLSAKVTLPLSPSKTTSERTEVLYGAENTTNAILNFLSNVDTMD